MLRIDPAPRHLDDLFAGKGPHDVRVALEVIETEIVQLDLTHHCRRALVRFELTWQAPEQATDTVGLLLRYRARVEEAFELRVDALQRFVEVAWVDPGANQPGATTVAAVQLGVGVIRQALFVANL